MRLATLPGSCLLALLLAGAPADAARKPITGKLSKPNYTVIALEPSGKAAVVRAPRGRFKLRPTAQSVTLQLRAPNGSYAGPVVVRRVKKKAILGLRPGARLGKVRVRRGYARVKKRPHEESIDTGVHARAKRGVPIGARRFGRVRSRNARNRGFGDRDLDGVPDVLDVDDDGDLILDRNDLKTPRRARTSQGAGEYFGFHSRLTLTLDETANANASSLTTQQVDAALSSHGDLLLNVLSSDPLPNSPELNCGGAIQQPPRPVGLIYCRPHSAGGIGTIHRYPPFANEVPFPDCCDLDDDGLGKLTGESGGPPGTPPAFTLHHHATTTQIGTGDVMIQTTVKDGVTTSYLASLQYVLATVPAMVSYDEEGPGGVTQIPYPFPGPSNGIGGGPGTRGNAAPVSDGGDGDDDVELTVTFWRPQRRAVPEWNESGTWIDIGGLKYEVQVEESGRRCPQAAFAESDPELAANNPSSTVNPGLTDLAPDRRANAANTFAYTLNLTRCLEANGFSFSDGGGPDGAHAFSFLATNPNGPDNSQQTVFFEQK